MPTLTLKVTPEFKRRLTRVARQRKLPVSAVVRAAIEKDLPADGKGWLLGACAAGASHFPAKSGSSLSSVGEVTTSVAP